MTQQRILPGYIAAVVTLVLILELVEFLSWLVNR